MLFFFRLKINHTMILNALCLFLNSAGRQRSVILFSKICFLLSIILPSPCPKFFGPFVYYYHLPVHILLSSWTIFSDAALQYFAGLLTNTYFMYHFLPFLLPLLCHLPFQYIFYLASLLSNILPSSCQLFSSSLILAKEKLIYDVP
jgi:hypothetical protein